MHSIISSWLDLVSAYAGWFAIISLVSLILSLLLAPVIVSRIPADYFTKPRRQRAPLNSRHQVLQLLITGVKNMVGIILVLAGLLMLFMPGQGLITLLVGLMIMNYPGKYALECWFIERSPVLSAMNWLRAKTGQAPLLPPER